MEINYSGKSALIVDSKLEDLGSLRQILGNLGVGSIQVSSSVNMALSLMREIPFDLCFSCYDMGSNEKNGLQLLQEAKSEGIFNNSGAFFLTVSEQNSELLFGSLENSPDTYISKPYDAGKVRFRVEKQLRIKESVRSVELFLDKREFAEAIEAVEGLQRKFPGLQVYLQRLKGIALLKMGENEQAKKLFEVLTEHREMPWAEVGKGIAYFKMGRFEESLECLNRVVDQQHVCVEAYTWLSRAYKIKGEFERAVTLMRKAVMLQPTVPVLQGELAELATQTQEWDISKAGYKQAIKYARYSAFQIPENYFGLAKALIESNMGKLDQVEPEIIRLLEDVVIDFSENEEIIFRAKLVNSDIYRKEVQTERLQQMVLQTWRFFQRMELDNQCKWIDVMLEIALETSIYEEVSEKRRELSRKIIELDWGKANYTAMSSYRKGNLEQAYLLFLKAHQLLPGHSGIALNLLQTGVELLKKGDGDSETVFTLQEVLSIIYFGSLSDKQRLRFGELSRRLAEIIETKSWAGSDKYDDPFSQEL
ncbi:MAG: tetratricopeptide repeat protein [Neptuniibacter sp.]